MKTIAWVGTSGTRSSGTAVSGFCGINAVAVKYVRRSFLAGLHGREPYSIDELNATLRIWEAEVANQRVHGRTHSVVQECW